MQYSKLDYTGMYENIDFYNPVTTNTWPEMTEH